MDAKGMSEGPITSSATCLYRLEMPTVYLQLQLCKVAAIVPNTRIQLIIFSRSRETWWNEPQRPFLGLFSHKYALHN